jgi:chemosensory pili system protein ChpA (sensor histidine kinase/response regulator)
MLEPNDDSVAASQPLNDLGPLAWVFAELRKSLDGANRTIKRYCRDAQQAPLGELEVADPGSLRIARQQLHQAVGALDMVGHPGSATVLRAMETVVERLARHPEECTEEAAARIERASFGLVEYLQMVLNDRPVHALALFPQYRDLQELAHADRVHPADLWSLDRAGVDLPAPDGARPLEASAKIGSLFDRVTQVVLQAPSRAASQQLARMSAGLSAGASQRRVITFWRVAAGFFDALSGQLLSLDPYVSRAASRILLQSSALQRAKPGTEVSETLLHDLLFFCAQARPDPGASLPHLRAVREAFALEHHTPVDYNRSYLGSIDPALVQVARKRLQGAKEVWAQITGGDHGKARQVLDQFALVGESLLRLQPFGTGLARALVRAAEQVARNPEASRPELSMEVATTTLYLEAALEDFEPTDATFAERVGTLAERLERVLSGQDAPPLTPWMEALYRRVSDRQTLGSVVGELKVSLAEAEKSLDQFFRSPQEKGGLHVAVSQLSQMRGVFSVLGLDQAVQTVARMRQAVEQILDTEVDEAQARQAGTFQQLGNNLSALSFLVDMLNYQPALARQLFVFDSASGELHARTSRATPEPVPPPAAQQAAQSLSADVKRVVEEAQNTSDLVDLSEQLGALAEQASLAEQPGMARAARAAAMAVVGPDVSAGAQALVGLVQTGAVAPSDTAVDVELGEEPGSEDDLRDIFLNEAREVVARGLGALVALEPDPADLETLTVLRRAFHTLKGSSRMVGLTEFGESAWSLEQLFNGVLAEQRAADLPLRELAQAALEALGQWVDDLEHAREVTWRADMFRRSAQHWRVGPGQRGRRAARPCHQRTRAAATRGPCTDLRGRGVGCADAGTRHPIAGLGSDARPRSRP